MLSLLSKENYSKKELSYQSIVALLKKPQINLGEIKVELQKRQRGGVIEINFQQQTSTRSDTADINWSLNGLSLLLDLEVARRLVKGDKFEKLPVLALMPYFLSNFDNIRTIEKFFTHLFGGEDRETFIKSMINDRRGANTKKSIREEIKMLHKESEDSGDDYASD